jgi:hypothetical protein
MVQVLDSEIMNGKALLKHLDTIIGLLTKSSERSMGKVDGGLRVQIG